MLMLMIRFMVVTHVECPSVIISVKQNVLLKCR